MKNKHPTAAFWLTVALVAVLVGYPLSFGPACWWFSRDPPIRPFFGVGPIRKSKVAPYAYWPVGWLAVRGPRSIRRAIFWYAMLGGSLFGYDDIEIPIDRGGVQHDTSGLLELEDWLTP